MSNPDTPIHSTLGASGAERWMECPGSVALLAELKLPPSDEPEYRAHGTAAHAVANLALTNEQDAWEFVDQKIEGVVIPAEWVSPIQLYLDRCREGDPDLSGTEQRIELPDHPMAFGTVDRWEYYAGRRLLKVKDFKFGAGIAVEVEENPQLMYYAAGILQLPDLADADAIEIEVVQPRAFHPDGPIRTWYTSRCFVDSWVNETLYPAMARTALDHTLNAGSWCRFCPAKLICPLMVGMYGAAMRTNPTQVVNLDNDALGRDYQAVQAVKMYIKAVEDQVFERMMRGQAIAFAKLVHKRANRIWKDEAAMILDARIGADAYSKPELRSPADLEKLSPLAKDLVREYAYTPTSGLTIAPLTDKRHAIKVDTLAETYKEFVE